MIMENVHLLASFWPIRIKLLEYYWIFRIVYDYSENCSILSECFYVIFMFIVELYEEKERWWKSEKNSINQMKIVENSINTTKMYNIQKTTISL